MALVPLSLIFEVLFFFLAIILYRESNELERLLACGLMFFEIALLVAPQQFFTDAGGTLAATTIAFPSALQGYIVFATFLLEILMLYKLWELHHLRDVAGKAGEIEG